MRWVRGEYADVRVDVPVRWLTGTQDPVITAELIDGYADHISDFEVELVDGVGHWIVAQRPDLVLDRVRTFSQICDYSTPMVTSVDLMNTVAA